MELKKDDRTWGTFIHLGGILGQAILSPVGNIIGVLVLWLIKRNDSEFLDQEGKEALNFQITISIVLVAINIITGMYWGFWSFGQMLRGGQVWHSGDWDWTFFSAVGLGKVVWFINVIFSAIGAVKANKGEHYRYPLSWRVVK